MSFLLASCKEDKSVSQMSSDEFHQSIVEIIEAKQYHLIEECKYRDQDNMAMALDQLDKIIENVMGNEGLSEAQTEQLNTYKSAVLPKLTEAMQLLAKIKLSTDEFKTATMLLEESALLQKEIFYQSVPN